MRLWGSGMSRSIPLNFSTFVFLDTETTGLPSADFHPRITEVAMVAVDRLGMLNCINLPRVQNKLSICFNPMSKISLEASKLSGLSSTNLFHQKDFDEMAVQQIRLFLLRLDSPVCIVAQNGYKFDFPLLNAEIFRVMLQSYQFMDCKESPVYCADSLHLFRHFSDKLISKNNATPGNKIDGRSHFSLSSVFERVFGSIHCGAHTAEGDCIALMKIVQYIGEPALSWIDHNYQVLSNIRKMYVCDEGDGPPLLCGQFPYESGLATSD